MRKPSDPVSSFTAVAKQRLQRNGRMHPISFIGFMGAGKTTWGKRLARGLNIPFVDLDSYIETKEAKTISQLFEQYGEASFRHTEATALRELLHNSPIVLSTGGGTPCFTDNLTWLKEKSTVIYLKADAATLANRLQKNYLQRPLLKHLPPDKLEGFIEEKLAEREPYYSQAHAIVNVIGLTVERLEAAAHSR